MKATGDKPAKSAGSARSGTSAAQDTRHRPEPVGSSEPAVTAQTTTDTTPAASAATAPGSPALGARDLRILQGAVGNRAVSRLVAQRYTA
ncbi:hypothetical protein ACFFHI_30480, partial [Streptomyces palmae]